MFFGREKLQSLLSAWGINLGLSKYFQLLHLIRKIKFLFLLYDKLELRLQNHNHKQFHAGTVPFFCVRPSKLFELHLWKEIERNSTEYTPFSHFCVSLSHYKGIDVFTFLEEHVVF